MGSRRSTAISPISRACCRWDSGSRSEPPLVKRIVGLERVVLGMPRAEWTNSFTTRRTRAHLWPYRFSQDQKKRYHGGHGNERRARIGFVQKRPVTSVGAFLLRDLRGRALSPPTRIRCLRVRRRGQ